MKSGHKDAVRLERKLTDIIMQMREYLDEHEHEDTNVSMISGKARPSSKDSSPRFSLGSRA